MKKTLILLSAFAVLASVFTGCKKEEPVPSDMQVTFQNALTAVNDFYTTWDAERTIPAEVKIGTKTFTISEFLYLEATLINNIKAANTGDITVVTYKAASNPDRDTYDSSEIAVVNGPADGKGVAEDITTIASRILDAAKEKAQIPNQTLIYRGNDAIAFCTNRAIVTIARAISQYKATGKLEGKVETEYLSAGASLKAFAQEFVKYLDIWENTVAESLSADGSHCEDNNTAWENVHFVPIPQDQKNEWQKQGGQWDAKYQPYKTVTIGTDTYTAANCWEIAIRGLMDMCTAEGNDFLQGMTDRNKAYTLANGKSLAGAPIRKPSENCIWGKYPWYESTNDGGTVKYNGADIKEVDLNFIIKCGSWHVVRGLITNSGNTALGMIGNFQQFGTTASTLNLEGYAGLISPMREFLILARVYKYILDNNINTNVYDALKDAKFDFDLYKQEALPVVITTDKLSFDAQPTAGQDAKFTTTGNWTATSAEAWIHINPASGAKGEITASVTVDNNTESTPRSGKITVAVGEYSKSIDIDQAGYVAPTSGTIADFATEFVKCLDVWEKTIGTVDADGSHNGATAWTNVHLLPIDNPKGYQNAGNQHDATLYAPFWKATIKGIDYTANQCWEMAIRGLMNLCTSEGEAFLPGMTDRNKAYTLANGVKMSADMPLYSANNVWGAYPWYEFDKTVTYNDKAISEVDINFILKCGSWHLVRGLIKNDGNTPLNAIGNYQEFGTGASTLNLEGYSGLISPMRELLIMARIYKYILDNNITENVYDAIKDKKFNFELYNAPKQLTIKDFATEYVKILDTWKNTTGTINMLTGENPGGETYAEYDVPNAHYVPDATTIKVGDKTYTTADMMEVGQRCYLLLRGWDGNWTGGTGVANYTGHELAGSTMSGTAIPETHGYIYNQEAANGPYNETAPNGGALTPTQVKCDILDNFAMRSTNWGITRQGKISNMCGYTNSQVAGYGGVFCARRALLTYAKFFQYMLDNKLETATEIPAAQTFESIMF